MNEIEQFSNVDSMTPQSLLDALKSMDTKSIIDVLDGLCAHYTDKYAVMTHDRDVEGEAYALCTVVDDCQMLVDSLRYWSTYEKDEGIKP